MRTKNSKIQAKVAAAHTPETKSQLNGTPKSASSATLKSTSVKTPSTTTKALKSPTTQPAQPAELSAEYRTRLHDWLDHTDNPFKVHTVPLSRKRKRTGANQLQVQDDLFEERLTVQYEVKPRDKWESLRRYKKFTVGTESIATGECILVKHDEGETPKVDTASQWKAKVLEVRALDPEHVYIRLSWLNRPEDLGSGRKDYHGRNELVPTNQMDIIDAMAVNGKLEVKHWDETADEDETSMPQEDEYFWRQTFDFANTKTFSALRKICVDDAPQNPDELIVQCSSGDCRKWLHVRCIAEQAHQRAMKARPKSPKRRKSALPTNPTRNPNLTPVAEVSKDSLTVEVFLKGQPEAEGSKGESATKDEIIVHPKYDEPYSEKVCCLFCGAEID